MDVLGIVTVDGDPLVVPPAGGGGTPVGATAPPTTPGAAREHVLDDLAPHISWHTRTDGSVRLTVLGDQGNTGSDVGP